MLLVPVVFSATGARPVVLVAADFAPGRSVVLVVAEPAINPLVMNGLSHPYHLDFMSPF